MKIAIMGGGGMGGWIGAKLMAAGNEVAFIARGAHLEALRGKGLTVSGAESLHLADIVATDNPGDIGTVDVVLFCVKLYDTESAAKAMVPLLAPQTCIDNNPPNGKSSQLVDLERGRRLELEGLSGAVIRLGRQTGIATPVHCTVYAALKPFVNGASE